MKKLFKEYSIEITIAFVGLVIIHLFFIPSLYRGDGMHDSEKAGQFGDFIGGYIGTIFLLFSIVFLYMNFKLQRITLEEMRSARIDSYKPELTFDNAHCYLGFIRPNEDTGSFNFALSNNKTPKSGKFNSNFSIKLLNVGFGVAKEVKYSWHFDFDLFKSYIKDSTNFHITKIGDTISVLNNIDGIKLYYSYFKNNKIINYITPSELKKNKIYPPDLYFLLYYICSNSIDSSLELNTLRNKIPPLYLEIEYFDVNNKKYTNKLKLHIRINFLSSFQYINFYKDNNEEFSTLLDVRAIKIID